MRRLLALLFVAFALVTLVACGGDDGDSSSEDLSAAPEDDGDDRTDESDQSEDVEVENPAAEGIDGVEAYDIEDNSHVEGAVDYDQSPPVGGPHNQVWVNCGFYSSEVPNENAVHALEHGVVWITYDDVDDDTLETLADLADDNDRLLVSEYPDQDSPLVLTAWNRQMPVDDLDDARVEDFIDTYTGDDSVAPEPGASCEGGVG